MENEGLEFNELIKYLSIDNLPGEYSLDDDILTNLLRQAIDGGYFKTNLQKKDMRLLSNGLPMNWNDEINT